MRSDPHRPPRGHEEPPIGGGNAVRRALLAPVTVLLLAAAPTLVLSSPAYAGPGDVTISADLEVAEGDTLTFDVTRAGGDLTPLTLNYAITAGTAESGEDFQAFGGQTTFAGSANNIIKRFNIRGISDAFDELDETVTVTFTNAAGGATVVEANGVFVDDDPTPNYVLSAPTSVAENAGIAVVTATLTAESNLDVQIPLTTSGGTATPGQDYTARTNEVLTIPANTLSGNLNVPILNDSLDEDDSQNFTVGAGSNPDTNVGTGNTVSIAIADNDAPPVVSVSDPGNAAEGSPLIFQAVLSGPSERTVTATANTANGSATAGVDYTAVVDQLVTFSPNDISEDISVTTATDLFNEVNPELLTLTLSNPGNASLNSIPTATGGIDDDDNAPTISLSPSSVMEGDSGTATQTFTVTLDAPSGRQVVVGYETSANTATAGVDYDDVTPGTLVFEPMETSKTFEVTLRGDEIDEGAGEAFNIVLSNPNNTLGASAALGTTSITVTDDDDKPTLNAMTGVTRLEGSGAADFTLSLSNPSAATITVDVAATDGSAEVNGSGAGSDDYDAPPGSVTFLPGQTSKTISVNVNADTVFEGPETADVVVTIPNTETDLDGSGVTATLTLTNDDTAPSVVVSTGTAAEGENLAVTGAVTGIAQDDIVVDIALSAAAGAGGVAADGPDFVNSGTVQATIPGGDNTGVAVPLRTFLVNDDDIDEANQQVQVTLTDPGNLIATASAYQTITDDPDDLPPTVTLNNVTVAEDAGTALVDVDLDFDSNTNAATSTEVAVVVPYTTVDGSAEDETDYTAAPANSSVTIAPGDLSESISIAITPDAAYELDETFVVNAGTVTPSGAQVVDGSATVTISENDLDSRTGFSVANVTKAENEGGAAVFTVTLDAVSSQPVTFAPTMANGTAVDVGSGAGSNDFNQPPTSVTIPAGTLSTTISVPVNNDTVYEATETATLNVALAPGETDAIGGPDASLLTITDADAKPSIVLTPESSAEGTNIAVVGTVTGAAQVDIVVNVAIAGDSSGGNDPAEASDFVNAGQTQVTIPAGDNSGAPLEMREFRLNNDTVDEPAESIVATVTDPNNVMASATAVYRINDDANDAPPAVSIGNATVSESDGTAVLDVDLAFSGETDATERPVVVNYTTVNGSALGGTDYTSEAPGQITIAPGDPGGEISIDIMPNTTDGPDRTFGVTLTSVSPAEAPIADGSGTVTITDDDADVPRPAFSVANASVNENEGPGVLTIELSDPTVNDVTFTVSTSDGTADDAGSGPGSNDYNPAPTTVTVPAGEPSAAINLPVNGDTVYEQNEHVNVTVALATGETDATGPADTSTLTIANDDTAPSIVLNTSSGTEGTDVAVIATVTGTAQAATTFDLTLSGNSSGTNNPAEGVDYDDSGLQGVIPPGTTSGAKVVLRSIRLEQDTIDEPAESITVLAQDTDNVVADASSVYRINDDVSDRPPSVSIGDAAVGEEDGTADLSVELTFDDETTETERDITINYRTVNGTALGGSDFTAITTGSTTIAAGDLGVDLSIPLTDDTANEAEQAFSVQITSVSPAEATITDDTGAVTITDDDPVQAPTLTAPAERLGTGPVTLTGTAGQGAQVALYSAPVGGGALAPAGLTTANSAGVYSFIRPLTTRGMRFATRVGDVQSPIRTVMLRHEPVLSATSAATGALTVRAGNDPKLANLTILIQRRNADGTWSTVATGTTASGGTFSRTFTGLRRGTSVVHRAYVVGNTELGYLGGYSSAFRATVR